MEIKDLAGLSQPLTRLIEIISQGVGAVARPYLIKKNASAKAEAVKTISNALGEVAGKHNLPVIYKEDGIEIWQKPEDSTLRLESLPVAERIETRLDFQERKRQHNVESIAAAAAAELMDEEAVPDQAPDEDWVSRFFSSAQDVSSEQMQELWGRILAGEIKNPGSFSLRTLDFVRNLTKHDAALIEKLSNLAFVHGTTAMIPVFEDEWLQKERGIYPMHHFIMGELGALYPSDLTFRQFHEQEANKAVLTSGQFILMLEKEPPISEVALQIWKFTQVGQEVLALVAPDGDKALVEKLGRHYARHGVSVQLGEIVERLANGQIRFNNARKVTADEG
ncbi:DUF2806 domain-containing protein [Luteimonas sp. BDR2-5]|uniref:DUF2806 domain-containing protein n=1 Tax=Proluteimonas luteida TaxID=2878685 RepID=UPI001E59C2E3|nr:DUF2806 domain-containing protein [Luteimonas sp. BDR2-5]